MNYLLTILSTPIKDNEFIVGFNRFMSPIVETDGIYVQYSNGLLLYHFDTKLDQLGVSDHIRELMDSFGVFVILTEVNSNTVFGIEAKHVDGLLNLGPDISIKNFPCVIYPKEGEPDTDNDTDEVVQKLMQKFKVKEIEPTLDEVLEKIHAKGISSLSIQEQAVLNQIK